MRQYIDILEEQVLLENRIEFLRQKYVPIISALPRMRMPMNADVLHDGRPEGYEGDTLGDQYDANSVFNFVVAVDPTPNRQYAEWILKQFCTGTIQPEDLYKIGDDLVIFQKFKSRMPVEARDINRYKTVAELTAAISSYAEATTQGEEDRAYAAQMFEQATVLLDDDRYRVVVPKTEEASCYFGRNTRWCTAATGSRNMFPFYDEKGPLYIILDKPANRRWQFHFEDNQFMDEADRQIDLYEFFEEHPAIDKLFGQVIYQDVIGKLSGNITVIRNQTRETVFRPEEGNFTDSLLSVSTSKYRQETVIQNVYNIDPSWVFNNGRKITKWFVDNGYLMNMSRGDYVYDPLWLLGFTCYTEGWKFRPSLVKNLAQNGGENGWRWFNWTFLPGADIPNTIHYLIDSANRPRFAVRVTSHKTFYLFRLRGYGDESDELDAMVAPYLLDNLAKNLSYADWDCDVVLPGFGGIDFEKLRPKWFYDSEPTDDE